MPTSSDPAAAIATRFDSSSEAPTYVIRAASGAYVRISEAAARLLALRDRGLAPAAIAAELSREGRAPVPTGAVEAGLARLDAQLAAVAAKPLSSGFLFELPLVPAAVVRPAARALAPLFHPWVAAALVTASIATILWLFGSRGVPPVAMDAVWPAFGLSLATLLAHELGHAAACARFGAPPSTIGFTLYVVYPAFYCDVSAAWTLSRWRRVVVDVGGFHFQLVAIAILAIAYAATGWAPLHLAAWMSLGTCALSLNPLFKFDGYWIVADVLGVANLATERTRILGHYLDRLRGRPTQPLPYPRWIRILLLPYTVVSFAFFGWFLTTAAPLLAAHLAGYPATVVTFATKIAGPGTTVLETISFLAATLVAVLAVMFFRTAVGWMIAAARTVHRHAPDIMRAMHGWLRDHVVQRTPALPLAVVAAAVLADAAASVIFHAGAAERVPSAVFAAASAAVVVGAILAGAGGLRPRHLGLDARELGRGGLVLLAGWCAIQLGVLAAGIARPPTSAAVAALLGQVLVISVVEEIIYRGVLLPRLVRAFRTVTSERAAVAAGVIASSLVFSLTHLPGLAGGDALDVAAELALLGGLGALLSLLYLRSGSLLTVAALHALVNAPTPFATLGDDALAAVQLAVLAAGTLWIALRRGPHDHR